MRANGVEERLCTGDADPFDKFKAWAATVPQTVRNPLYHWTHLELARYFGITELLNEESARGIWDQTSEMLAGDALSVHGILKKFKVTCVCTTDDPTDDLRHHQAIAASDLDVQVLPAWRPDKAFGVDNPEAFNAWTAKLEAASNVAIGSFADFLAALDNRLAFFHENGCRLSDHGLEQCPASFQSKASIAAVFDAARSGKAATPEQREAFATFVLFYLGEQYAGRGWTMQMHLGALRNNNDRLLKLAGPDTGFDSIGDFVQGPSLSRFLNRLDSGGSLPNTILYNLNPSDNYLFATMAGNYQQGPTAGKMQLGSGWWFLDQKEGMEWQMNALSNLGLLSKFVGMVTASRSFMSYPRHEYFRRVLCNLVGRDVENGEIPNDDRLLRPLIENVCYHNAKQFMAFPELSPAG